MVSGQSVGRNDASDYIRFIHENSQIEAQMSEGDPWKMAICGVLKQLMCVNHCIYVRLVLLKHIVLLKLSRIVISIAFLHYANEEVNL
mgnify:CR=1 FL=1